MRSGVRMRQDMIRVKSKTRDVWRTFVARQLIAPCLNEMTLGVVVPAAPAELSVPPAGACPVMIRIGVPDRVARAILRRMRTNAMAF